MSALIVTLKMPNWLRIIRKLSYSFSMIKRQTFGDNLVFVSAPASKTTLRLIVLPSILCTQGWGIWKAWAFFNSSWGTLSKWPISTRSWMEYVSWRLFSWNQFFSPFCLNGNSATNWPLSILTVVISQCFPHLRSSRVICLHAETFSNSQLFARRLSNVCSRTRVAEQAIIVWQWLLKKFSTTEKTIQPNRDSRFIRRSKKMFSMTSEPFSLSIVPGVFNLSLLNKNCLCGSVGRCWWVLTAMIFLNVVKIDFQLVI